MPRDKALTIKVRLPAVKPHQGQEKYEPQKSPTFFASKGIIAVSLYFEAIKTPIIQETDETADKDDRSDLPDARFTDIHIQ